MAFTTKTWKDRKTEYPNRRKLTDEDGNEKLVTVAREEGSVIEEGDPFSAETMNDFEQRVQDGFNNTVSQGAAITDITQITSGGMYYSNGNVANAPTSDGVYYDYVAIPHGWIVNLIARSGSDGATYVSINSTSDGSTWTNSGWSRLMTRDDITADGDNLILNWL